MKRIISIILAVSFSFLFFCGCKTFSKPKSLAKSIEISDSGIVKASVFEQIKNNNQILTLNGRYENYDYIWTVYGANIKSPKDFNFAIEVFDETKNGIKFKTLSDVDFDFNPNLAIHLNEKKNISKANLYKDNEFISDVFVSFKDKKTVLNFQLIKTGKYNIKFEKSLNIDGSNLTGKTADDQKSQSVESDGKETKTSSKSAKSSDKTSDFKEAIVKEKTSENKTSKSNKSETAQSVKGDNSGTNTDYSSSKSTTDINSDAQSEENENLCTISINCSTIFNNLSDLNPDKFDVMPFDGKVLEKTTISFNENDTVYDVLCRVCSDYGIQIDAEYTPLYSSYYVKSISNLYEKDCGEGSGWMYSVDGFYPNYGCSKYVLKNGQSIEFNYTCDFGFDVGNGFS